MANQTTIVDGYPHPIFVHHEWMQRYYGHVAAVAITAYLLMLAFGPGLMKKRPAFSLQRPLFYWNLLLCLFSTFGLLSVLPEFADTLYNKGLEASYCWLGDQYQGYNGEWVWLFHASKLMELGDTVFLVLRKKPIKFLHWYHHTTVLMYAAYSYYRTSACRWGVFMNYFVHSVMYCYFAYSALGQKWSSWVAPVVTGIQILQFIIGLYVSIAMSVKILFIESSPGPLCQTPINVSMFQTLMYCSYLVLFVHFFYVTHLSKMSQTRKPRKVD